MGSRFTHTSSWLRCFHWWGFTSNPSWVTSGDVWSAVTAFRNFSMKAETWTSRHQSGFHFTAQNDRWLFQFFQNKCCEILKLSTLQSSRFRPSFNNQHKSSFPKRYHYVNTKLEVRKVPRELNNITKLNEHFSKFGTIVNIQVKCNICCRSLVDPVHGCNCLFLFLWEDYF